MKRLPKFLSLLAATALVTAAAADSSYGAVEITDNKTGTFTPGGAHKVTQELVLEEYLPTMIGKYIGKKPKDVNSKTTFKIPSKYNNIEGDIPKGVDKEKGWVRGLRLDLQKAQVHNGHSYATFQVQWGSGMDNKKGGAYAGGACGLTPLSPSAT